MFAVDSSFALTTSSNLVQTTKLGGLGTNIWAKRKPRTTIFPFSVASDGSYRSVDDLAWPFEPRSLQNMRAYSASVVLICCRALLPNSFAIQTELYRAQWEHIITQFLQIIHDYARIRVRLYVCSSRTCTVFSSSLQGCESSYLLEMTLPRQHSKSTPR
jgi:hypothetical protein